MDLKQCFLCGLILVGITYGTTGDSAEVVTLAAEDLPRLVQMKNQNVSGAKLITEASESRTGHLARSFLPKVHGEIGGETFSTGTFGMNTQPYGEIEASVNLYRGGKDHLEEKIRKAQFQVTKNLEKRVELSELSEARKHYWHLVFTREMIDVLQDALKQNEKNLVAANRRISRGLAARTDRIEFEINGSQIQEEIESLNHEVKIIQIKLSAPLGLPLDTDYKTAKIIPHEHHEIDLKKTFNSSENNEVNLLRANASIEDFQKSSNQRWWLPSVDLYSQYSLYTLRDRAFSDLGDRDDLAIGVRMRFTFFDGFQTGNAASASEILSQAYETQALQKARSQEAELRASQEEMKHDHELIHEAEKRIEQGKAYLFSTLEEYDRGVKNSPDVLNATEKFTSFRRRYVELRRDYQLSRAKLLAVSSTE